MDLSKLSNADLLALEAGDMSKLSNEGLNLLDRQLNPPAPTKKSTIGSELVRGAEQLFSSYGTGLSSLQGQQEARTAGISGIERAKEIAEKAGEGPSLDALKQAYADRGFLGATGELVSQAPRAVAGQAANIGAMGLAAAAGSRVLSGARAGAVLGPWGAAVGGALGAASALLPQFFGSNVERQVQEQREAGVPDSQIQINRGAAMSSAMAQSLAEGAGGAITIGKRALGGILGKDLLKTGGVEAEKKLVDIANRSLGRTIAGGAARGAAVELPVEVAQSILERAQAGLPLLDDDAKAEYGDTIYQTFIAMAPVGGAGAAYTRSGAKKEVAAQQAEKDRLAGVERERLAEEEKATKQAEYEARAAEPGYIPGLIEQYNVGQKALSDLKKQSKDRTLTEEQRDELKIQFEAARDQFKTLQDEYTANKDRITEYQGSQEYFDQLIGQRDDLAAQIAQAKDQSKTPGIDDTAKKALLKQVADLSRQRNVVEKELLERPEQLAQFDATKRAAAPKPATYLELAQQEQQLTQDFEAAIASGDTAAIAQVGAQHKAVLSALNKHPQRALETALTEFDAEQRKEEPNKKTLATLATQIESAKKKGADETIYRERMAAEQAERDAVAQAARDEETNALLAKMQETAERARVRRVAEQQSVLQGEEETALEGPATVESYTNPEQPNATTADLQEYQASLFQPAPKEVGPFQPEKKGSTTRVLPPEIAAREEEQKAADVRAEQALSDLLGIFNEQRSGDFVRTEPEMQPQQHTFRARESDVEVSDAELRFNEALDNLATGTYVGGKNNAAASSTEEGLRSQASAAQAEYIDSALKYVEHMRAASGLAPLKTERAIRFAYDAKDTLGAAVKAGKPDSAAFKLLRKDIEDMLKQETRISRNNVQLGLFGSVEQRVSKLKNEQYGEPEGRATYSELIREKETLQRAVAGLEKTMAEHKEAGRVPKYSKRYEIDANSLKQYKQALSEIDARIAAAEKGGVAKKELVRSPEQIEKSREIDFVVERLREAEDKASKEDAAVLKAARLAIVDEASTPELIQEANRQAARAIRGQDINTLKLSELTQAAKQSQAGEGAVGVKETPIYSVVGGGTAKGLQSLRGSTERGEQVGVEKGKTKYAKGVQQELPGIDPTRTERVGPQQWARYMVSHERELWRMNWETERKNLVSQLKVMAGNFKRAANQAAAQTAKMEAAAKQAEISLNMAFTEASADVRDGVLKFETKLEDLVKSNIEKSTPVLIEQQVKEAKDEYNKFVFRAQPVIKRMTSKLYYADNATAIKARDFLDRIYAKQEMLAERVEVAAQGLYEGQLQRVHRSTVLSNAIQNEIKRLDSLNKKLDALKKPPTEYQQRMKEQRAVLGAAEARINEAKQKATDDARKAQQRLLEAQDATASVHYTVESVMVQMPDSKGGEPIMAYAVTEAAPDKAKRSELNKGIAEAREAKEKAFVAGDQSEVNRQDRKLKQLFAERANLGQAVRERVARTAEPASDRALEKAAEAAAASGEYGTKKLTAKQRAGLKEEVSPTIEQLQSGEASLIKEPVTKYTVKAAQKTKPTTASRVSKTAAESVESARVALTQKELRRQASMEVLEEKGEFLYMSAKDAVQRIRYLNEVIADKDNSTAAEIKEAREEKAALNAQLKANRTLVALGDEIGKRVAVPDLLVGKIKETQEIQDAVAAEKAEAQQYLTREANVAAPAKPVDPVKASRAMATVEAKLNKSGIKLEYYETLEDLPLALRRVMALRNVDTAKGIIKPDGTIVVIGDMHSSVLDLEKTVAHEVIGHYGVEGAIGEQGIERMANQLYAKPGEVNRIAAALGVAEDVVGAEKAAKAMGMSEKETRMLVTRELIAHTAEAKARGEGAVETVKSWIRQLISAVRTWFKTIGMDEMSKQTTKDIQKLVNDAFKQYVRNELPVYQAPNGEVHFRWGNPAYATGYNAGAIALEQKLIGRQKNLMDTALSSSLGMQVETRMVDARAPIEKLAKGLQGTEKELMGIQTLFHVRSHDARMLATGEAATNGPPKLVKEITKDGKETWVREASGAPGLLAISKRAAEAKGIGDANTTLRQFGLYLIAKRALRVGVEKALGFDLSAAELAQYKQQFKDILELHKDNTAFKDAARMYAEYNKALMNFVAQSGYISQATADALTKHGDYVGFYRQGDKLMDGEGVVTIGDMSKQKYLQELVGGSQQIVDFQTSSIHNTAMLMELALRNLATKSTANMLSEIGYAKIRNSSGPASSNIVRFKDHGKELHAVIDTDASGIPTELMMESMEGVPLTLPTGLRLMQGPASLLKKWVTRMPLYAVRQVMRDSLATSIVNGSDSTPIISAVKSIMGAYTGKDKTHRILQEGGFLGGQQFSGSVEDIKKIMNDVAAGKKGWSAVMAKLDAFAAAADASARQTAYRSYIAQGMSNMEAQLASLEIMNFTKRGTSATAAYASMMIPFFNAQVQGLNVLAKAFRGTSLFEKKLDIKSKLYKRGMTLMGMSLLYAAAMQDDEAYKNATEEEKLMYWFVRLPGLDEPVRVPIPFEVGYIFKALPEALYNLAYGDAKAKDVLEAFGTVTRNTIPGGSNWMLPQAVKPLIEVGTNYSFFTGSGIESKRFEGIEPGMRYDTNTTELAKSIGSMLNVSPIKLDYLVRGYLGSAGTLGMAAMNPLLSPADAPERATRKLSEMPFIGTAFQPNDGRGMLNSAYNIAEDVVQAQGTYKSLADSGRIEEAAAYADANADLLALGSSVGSFKQRMGELAAQRRKIEALPASVMDADTKREIIDEIRKIQIEMAKELRSI